jgi:hypothetical protein
VFEDAAEDGMAADATTPQAPVAPFYATFLVEADANTTSTVPETEMLSTNGGTTGAISRRDWLQKGAAALLFGGGGAVLIMGGGGGTTLSSREVKMASNPKPKPQVLPVTTTTPAVKKPKPQVPPVTTTTNPKPKQPQVTPGTTNQKPKQPQVTPGTTKPAVVAPPPKKAPSLPQTLEPVNFTKVAAETNINVTLACPAAGVTVDSTNFTKIQTAKVPSWVPSFLAPLVTPKPKVIKLISNSELLIAATVAGTFTEMGRTSILYPIQTIKTRVQTDVHNYTYFPPTVEERFVNIGVNIRRHVMEGNLYAGIAPSLLVSVPATGLYYGVREVTKRMLSMMFMGDVAIALSSAVVADVVSLSFRAPADALALRLQAQPAQEDDEDVGDWLGDSLKRLPMIIITDLPYLVSKVFLNKSFIHGSVSIDRYVEYAFLASVGAAFLTTPFDVARTRILVDSDGDVSNGLDGGSGEGVLKTMKDIMREGNGGVANLFAGWLERVLYFGIGRAWLEPIQIIGYIGIRDAVLLEWF